MDQLPQHGEWHLSNPVFSPNPPFAVVTVDFRGWTGTARYLTNTVALGKVERIAPNQFRAHYSVNGNVGIFEAEYLDDQTLLMTFYGSVETSCVARPVSLVGGERPVAKWSTAERVQASIERALPLLPGDVAQEIRVMLTPSAVAVMAGILAFWGVSHFFGVGEVVDVLLLVTGGVLLGAAAIDVAEHLMAFARISTSASSEADLDVAASHFATAVAKGGVQAVLAILMWRGARGARPRVGRPAAASEAPASLNAVPPSRIPAASRVSAALTEMGEQPRLAGLGREIAEAVRAAMNRMRRTDVRTAIDCEGGSMELQRIAGGVGDAMEHNARSPFAGWDHTMWKLGDEVVDVNPGGWRRFFEMFPERRAALEKEIPGLAQRLLEGAVLSLEEFARYMGLRRPPKSPMFSTDPIPGAGRRGG